MYVCMYCMHVCMAVCVGTTVQIYHFETEFFLKATIIFSNYFVYLWGHVPQRACVAGHVVHVGGERRLLHARHEAEVE